MPQHADDAHGGKVYLWPDNTPSWNAWLLVQGRWRFHSVGPEQLDMAGCAVLLRAFGYRWRRRERPNDLHRVLADLSVMETEALSAWQRQSEKKRRGAR